MAFWKSVRFWRKTIAEIMNIIAKIENMQGLENMDEIIHVSDGIMIARGDMGVEIRAEMFLLFRK